MVYQSSVTRSAVRSFVAALAAVLQIGIAAAPVLDADRDPVGPTGHVESSTSATCTPPHASDCGVCRVLSAGQMLAGAVTIDAAQTAEFARPGDADRVPLSLSARRQPPARGPPLA